MLHRRSKGQAMVEFLIVIPVLLMLILGAIQMALLYSIKTSLNYATFEAARHAAIKNASYEGARIGLIRGLIPLFTRDDSMSELYCNEVPSDDLSWVCASGKAEYEVDNFVRIERINPTVSAFAAFGEQAGNGRDIALPNDNLMFRDPQNLDSTGLNIQDANLLKLRVTYCARLVVPVISSLLGVLNNSNDETPSVPNQDQGGVNVTSDEVLIQATQTSNPDHAEICSSRAQSNRGFLIQSEAIVRMQSPAFQACHPKMICY